MRRHRAWVAAAFAAAVFASGCSGPALTPNPSATVTPTGSASVPPAATAGASAITAASPTPTAGGIATASPSSAVSDFYLRSWTLAPIGPDNSFGSVPLVISDGQLLTATYAAGTDPYPLYAPPMRRTISQVGLTTIVTEAQSDGLLGTVSSFICPHGADDPMMAGTGTDHLVLIVVGVTHELSASCPYQQPSPGPGAPSPATWAAFEHFKKLLADPASWLGTQAGPPTPYDPAQLAVLAVPADISAGTPNPTNVVPWPLATPFASFGISSYGDRCAVVSGSDAATLLAVVKGASATTLFRDGSGAFAELIVRVFMPGEPDPCQGG
ncbi:MAG: hypothetical protein ACHQ01_07210 [Candidatus Limnocylindrales bacterium]